MPSIQRKYKWQKNKSRHGYLRASRLLEKAVDKVIPPKECVAEVLDQADLGSCVINSGMQLIRMTSIKEQKLAGTYVEPPPLGSRLQVYYECLSFDGLIGDNGTNLSTFYTVVNSNGYCAEKYWPYDTSKFTHFPPMIAAAHSYDYANTVQYYMITSTGTKKVDDIYTAIRSGYGVHFGTIVGAAFENYAGTPLSRPSDCLGGHALLCIDVLPNGDLVILNSWGTGYGNNGYCIFKPDYMAWDETTDCTIIKSAPQTED